MRSGLIGSPGASRSNRYSVATRKAGFTLLEALVALALVLAFASVLAPHLFQARRIVHHAEDRLAAQVLLRTLLDAPFDRASLASASREGDAGNLHWRLTATPLPGATTDGERPRWVPVRVAASVSWARGQAVSAETLRLARAE